MCRPSGEGAVLAEGLQVKKEGGFHKESMIDSGKDE
jgi:hypothetical protein